MIENCQNCKYYWIATKLVPAAGYCRRLPKYEHHELSDWCGEFEQVFKPGDILNERFENAN